MNIKLTYCLIAFCSLIFSSNFAQKNRNDCWDKIKKAEIHLKGKGYAKRDTLKALNILKPCAEAGNPQAQVMMGRLLYADRSGIVSKDRKKAFKMVKKAADKNNANGAFELGMLYKKGIGCDIDFNKAMKWYRKADKLGNEMGAYYVGYLYYKGLGSIDQDYGEAVYWFNKSKYPMAKHFLGYCYYFGYGVPKDKEKAKEIFRTNKILNSYLFLRHINKHKPDSLQKRNAVQLSGKKLDSTYIDKKIITKTKESKISFKKVKSINEIKGDWNGKLIEYDWSGKHIVRVLPISISLSSEKGSNNANCAILINNQKAVVESIVVDNTLYFEDLNMVLDKLYPDLPFWRTLKYDILSSSFSIKRIKGTTYLTGKLETNVVRYKEPGPPMHFVLRKNDGVEQEELSEEALDVLAKQEDSFISLYPNPFSEQLLIEYDLDSTSQVKVELYDFTGNNFMIIQEEATQEPGKYTYNFDGSVLSNGIYIVRVFVNGIPETKLIVKH